MKYREDKISGNMLSILGMGCMRFPQVGGEAERTVLKAIEGGVNFFDTAYIYPGSEKTLGGILAKHNKRSEVFIATKMPIGMCKKYEDFDKFFDEQLYRLQTDYVDYYFMHNIINMAQWDDVLALGIEKWVTEKKAAGKIRRIGFSYHGSGEEFPRVLDSFDWEFCMIQYNYYDENYQAGKNGLKAAASRGLPIFIMEPLLGGKLAAGLPPKAEAIFKAYDANKTPAEWALQWVWNHTEATVVLSGMTNAGQAEANMKAASSFVPLSEAELASYTDVVDVFRESFKVRCTSCNYCLPCPKNIDIPARLSAYNASYAQGYFAGLVMYFTGMGIMNKTPIWINSCNNCGKCEKDCPQGIEIRKELKKVGRRLEPRVLRGLIRVVKFIVNLRKP
ncbi:MAG: aldo/keto reductase [Defluviitaleaceae bacterium]|nr:aldo/keto reductase [Defluviitaleaceae bacterium]